MNARPDEMRLRPLSGFARGFSYPFRALSFLRHHPGLLKYLGLPLLINLVVFSVCLYFGFRLFDGLLQTYAPAEQAWYAVLLYSLAWLLALLISAVLVFFSFTAVGNLIASPFNELLSEKTEQLCCGPLADERFSLGRFWREAGYAMRVEVKKLALFAVSMLVLLILNLLPLIGPWLYALAAPVLTLFFLVVEYMAFVLMRKHLSFAQQRRYIFRRPLLMAGFGCGIFVFLALPLVQFFSMPLAVIGATLLWRDFPDLSPEPSCVDL